MLGLCLRARRWHDDRAPWHQTGREHAQEALKRRAEAELWRTHVEMKAVELQAALLEQRSILTWGPVALEVLRPCRAVAEKSRRCARWHVLTTMLRVTQTGRLDEAALLQIQRGIKQLNVSEISDRQITCKIVECARLEPEPLC